MASSLSNKFPEMSTEEFLIFLREEIALDESTIEMLVDGGFDNIDSLYLTTVDTLRLLGFSDPD